MFLIHTTLKIIMHADIKKKNERPLFSTVSHGSRNILQGTTVKGACP